MLVLVCHFGKKAANSVRDTPGNFDLAIRTVCMVGSTCSFNVLLNETNFESTYL